MPRLRLPVAVAFVAVLASAGCSPSAETDAAQSPTPGEVPVTDCSELPAAIAAAVQTYVDSFADAEAQAVTAEASTGQEDFATATARLRTRGEELGCDPEQTAAGLNEELALLSGGTPVQDAVLATFLADPLGTVNPADPAAVDIEVSSTNELTAAVSLAGSGSTIRVAPGTYVVGEPLVVLRPMRIVGAGSGDTVIRSIAPDAAVIVDAGGDVGLDGLTVQHDVSSPASVVVVTAGGYDLRDVAISGARTTESGAGGFGLILRPTQRLIGPGGTTSSVVGVELADNAGGGVLVAADARPTLRDITVSQSGGCGLCFVEDSGGDATGIAISQVRVGLRTDDSANPQVTELVVRDAEAGIAATGSSAASIRGAELVSSQIGVEVVDDASPDIDGLAVRSSSDIGVRAGDRSTLTVADLTIGGATPVGVAAVDSAAVDLSGATVGSEGEASIVASSSARLSGRDLLLRSARIGLQADADAELDVETVDSDGTEAAALLGGQTTGVLGISCAGTSPVVLAAQAGVEISAEPSCSVLDRRD